LQLLLLLLLLFILNHMIGLISGVILFWHQKYT